MKRNQDETFIGYCQRLTEALKRKEIPYSEWADGVAGNTNYGDETLRRVSTVFKMFLDKWNQDGAEDITDADVLAQIELEKKELLKERKKLQTENAFYQARVREEARGEMFNEKIYDAIAALPKFDITPLKAHRSRGGTGVLCIADAHYGTDIVLKSLFGEVVNVYNPEVFKARIRMLAGQVVADYDKFQYDNLIIFDLGDAIENIIRTSSLQKLKIGMVDAALEYAEIMSLWIVELRNALGISVKYAGVGGNHDLARLLSSKKDFPEENMMKVIVKIIQLRLADCDGIEVADFAECQFENICGENVMIYHGDETKNELEEITFWENYQDTPIDLLILGHKHSKTEKGVGYASIGDKEVIYVNSIVGPDQYSKKIRKISRAGAKFLVFEKDRGRAWETTYYLN